MAIASKVRDLLGRFPECVLLGGIAARQGALWAAKWGTNGKKRRTAESTVSFGVIHAY